MVKPRSIYVERVFTYNCPSEDFCLTLIEKIDEELSLESDVHVEYKGGKLVVRAIGLEPHVISSINAIRNYISQLQMIRSMNPRRGVSVNDLAKIVKKTIPLDVLAEVLKIDLGVYAKIENNMIYADIDLETLLSYCERVSNAMDRVFTMSLSHSLRKLFIASIALYNISPQEILTILSEQSLIDEKMELKIPWTKALSIIDAKLSKES